MRAARRLFGRLAVVVTAVASLTVTGAAAGQAVMAARQHQVPRLAPATARTLPPGVRPACSAWTGHARRMSCFALIRGAAPAAARDGGTRPGLAAPGAYAPADLRRAYSLAAASASAATGRTVAIVDAFDDPHAAADLATYRRQWGLPACDPATSAGCLTKVNAKGAASPLPPADPAGGWEVEESLDVDMVAAICPNCHILLVEASSDFPADLEAAEDRAVAMGARYVSDSWGGTARPADDKHFNHPGVAIVAAAGDYGYLTSFPASSQFVTSVGGTSLVRDPRVPRGWTETAWTGTGSGCAAGWAKPAWQRRDNAEPAGCLARTDNDVSAVGDPDTGVWVYDSTAFEGQPVHWQAVGGTSASAPIVAGVYALAGLPAAGSYPASYPYLPGRVTGLNDVTAGSNGNCEAARAYLCHAVAGYDGPTGLGTPDGVSAFAAPAGRVITVINPGNRDASAGQRLRLTVHAVDSAARQRLTYSAAGLPRGLSISAGSGQVSGTLPASGGTYHVTVTAADSSGARGSVTFRVVAVPSLRAAYRKVTGPVRLTLDPSHVRCLTVAGSTLRAGAMTGLWPCDGRAAQRWTYTPDISPDGAGRLIIGGMCLTIGGNGASNGARTELEGCDSATRQQWSLQAGPVSLLNPATRRCLDDPANRSGKATPNGTPVDVFDCTFLPGQAFTLPAGPVLSAIAGMCVTDPGNKTAAGTPVTLAKCDGGSAQKWDIFSSPDGFPAAHGGRCWIAAPVRESDGTYAFLDGTPVRLGPCDAPVSGAPGAPPADFGAWFPLPDGEIQSGDSGLCLADPGNAAAPGKALVLNECYGDPGEIWAVA